MSQGIRNNGLPRLRLLSSSYVVDNLMLPPPHPMTEVRRKKGHVHQRRNINAYRHILQVMYDTDVELALMVCALPTLVLFPTQEVVAALVEVSANCQTRQRTS